MASTVTAPPSSIAEDERFAARRVLRFVGGGLGVLVALACFAAVVAAIWAIQTHRDSQGYFTTATHNYETSSYGLVSESLKIRGGSLLGLFVDRLRLTVTGSDPGKPLFVGIARTSDVDRYLAGVEHDWVGNIEFTPFKVDYRRSGTAAPASPPAAQRFWQIRRTGNGTQAIIWPLKSGSWSAVAMNADGSRGVSANIQIAASVAHVWWYVTGLLLVGGLSLLGGGALVYSGMRKERAA